MVTIEDDWSQKYVENVKSLEQKLGREICGIPVQDNEPCTKWPVDDKHGRCSDHIPPLTQSSTDQARTGINGQNNPKKNHSKVEDTSTPDGESNHRKPFYLKSSYWIIISVIGIFVGGAGMATYKTVFGDKLRLINSSKNSDQEFASSTKSGSGNINPSNPDFQEIRSLYQDGEVQRVAIALQKILDANSNPNDQARALYYQFVLYQNQDEYEKALEIADRVLQNHSHYHRLPEILYGAAFLCRRYLNNEERASQYITKLKDKYPESKWTQKFTDSS